MRKLIALVSGTALLISGLALGLFPARAEVGGATLEQATLVGEGEHDLGLVSKEMPKYVKIQVKGGQQLEAKFVGEANYMYSNMYIPPSKEDMGGGNGDDLPHTFRFAPGNLDSGDGGEVYFGITKMGGTGSAPVKVSLALSDVSDAKSGRDAGDTFNRALLIEPGSYKGYLNYFMYSFKGIEVPRGTDSEDFYMLKLKKGQALTVSVSPHSSVKLRLRIYDASRAIKVEQASETSGAIVTGRYVAPKDQDVYFQVRYYEKDIDSYDAKRVEAWAGKYYDFAANVEAGAVVGEQAPPAGVPSEVETLRPGKASKSGEKTFRLEAAANRVVSLKVSPADGQGIPEFVVLNADGKTPPQYAVQYLNGSRELQVKATGRNTKMVKGKGAFYVTVKGVENYTVEYKVLAKSCL